MNQKHAVRNVLLVLAVCLPLTIFAASFTVSRTMIAQSGVAQAGFVDPSNAVDMAGNIISGFTVVLPTNGTTALSSGGITNPYAGSFIAKVNTTNTITGGTSTAYTVALTMDAANTKTVSVLQAGRGISIDGCATNMYATPNTNGISFSWAWADK